MFLLNAASAMVTCISCIICYHATKIVMIYLLTAIGLSPGGRSTVHIYTHIHRTIQNKQYVEQHKNFGRVRAVPLRDQIPEDCSCLVPVA